MTSLSCKLGTCAANRRTPSTKPNEPAVAMGWFTCKLLIKYKLTGRPAHDGLAQVDCSGRRFGALQRPLATEQARRTPTLGILNYGSISERLV